MPGSISTRQSARRAERRRGAARRRRGDRAVRVRSPSSAIVPLTAEDGEAGGGLKTRARDAIARLGRTSVVATMRLTGRSRRRSRPRVDAGGDAAVAGPGAGEVGRGAHRQRGGVRAERRADRRRAGGERRDAAGAIDGGDAAVRAGPVGRHDARRRRALGQPRLEHDRRSDGQEVGLRRDHQARARRRRGRRGLVVDPQDAAQSAAINSRVSRRCIGRIVAHVAVSASGSSRSVPARVRDTRRETCRDATSSGGGGGRWRRRSASRRRRRGRPSTASPPRRSARTTVTALIASAAATLARMSQRGAAEADREGDAAQVVGHQRDVGGLERRRRAGRAHRDADVRRGQRRRVVDAVADHRHRPVRAARSCTSATFCSGSSPAARVDAARRPPRGRRRVIAAEHGDVAEAGRAQLGDRVPGVRLRLVAERTSADRPRVARHQDDLRPRDVASRDLRLERAGEPAARRRSAAASRARRRRRRPAPRCRGPASPARPSPRASRAPA